MYSYEECMDESLKYFDGNELAASVFIDKYALRNADGELLEKTPADMHKRIAKEFARIEKKKFKDPLSYEEIYGYLEHFGGIIPQGSPMYGIGNKYQTISLSNCYVLGLEDSYGSILYTDQQLVQISKRRGGIGISLDNLRPEGTVTNNSSRTSTGIISFAKRFSNSIREVGQHGRRGALMMTLNVHHPQILDFIHCKDDETQVTGANISVCLTDEFLKAVENDEEYELRWPINSDTPQVSKMVSAKYVWDEIIKCAHNRAEPGLLFWDNVLRESPADCYSLDGFRTISTNPCSELPLCISDSCRLLVIVLFACIKNAYTKNAKFDFDKLYKLAYIAQRLMDDMVDLELESISRIIKKIDSDPEPDYIKQVEKETWEEIYKKCESGRRTGTGITTVGDTLAACGYEYGSNRGNKFVEKIQKTIKLAAYRCSVDMAKELGAFPIWDGQKEKDNPFLLRIKEEDPSLYEDMQTYGRRNIALLTIAPTGTVSILAGLNVNDKWYHNTTSGIEPLFKGWYIRRKKVNHNDKNVRVDFVDKTGDSWMEFPVYHSGLKAWMDLNEIDEINDENQHLSPYYGSCANDIDWTQRVKLQALANKHVDHAISSTINLPNDASIEDVSKIYETAWKTGYCKGMTVYRDGCRSGVIIDKPSKSDTISTEAAERPKVLNCEIHHITARTQPYFVLVGLLDGKPYEVFAGRNGILDDKIKEGQIVKVGRPKCYRLEVDGETLLQPITSACDEEQEALTRMISVCLRHHTPLNFLVDQIEKVQGDMMAFSKAIARVLKKYIPDGTPVDNTCPKCESRNLERQEGCAVCKECGYSACS